MSNFPYFFLVVLFFSLFDIATVCLRVFFLFHLDTFLLATYCWFPWVVGDFWLRLSNSLFAFGNFH